jgi:DNA-binding NarL/FixJ family response regulator
MKLALERITSQTIDIILLDLWIPGTNPIENVLLLKRNFPSLPIMIYTTDESEEWVRKMFAAGVMAYVTKKMGKPEIKSAIKEVHAGKTVFYGLTGNKHSGKSVIMEDKDPFDLSPLMRDIIKLLSEGKSHKEIADIEGMPKITLEVMLHRMRKRFYAANNIQLIKICSDLGLV